MCVCYHYATTECLVRLSKEDVHPPTQKTQSDYRIDRGLRNTGV